MAVRTFTCPRDNAQFQEPDAARLCVQCKEPFLPRACQIRRCSSCGAEARNGSLACECANGRLQVAGYRCPSCRHEGGDEMLAAGLACPYCFHALPEPEAAPPKPPFPFRRVSRIAALCLLTAVAAAAALKYGIPVVERWLQPSKSSSSNPPISEQPGNAKPPAGHALQPQEAQQLPSNPQDSPPGQPPDSAPGQPGQQPSVVPGAALTPTVIVSFTASPQTIQRGSTATLQWVVTGDNPTVTLSPGVGAVPPTGRWNVTPQATQQFTLTASNTTEAAPQTSNLVVVVAPPPAATVPPPAPTIVSFTADAGRVQLGQSTILRWVVLGASDVRIDPAVGQVGLTGSSPVRPQGNTAYVLTATGPGGTRTGTLPIGVVPPSAPPAYPNGLQPPNPTASNRMPFSRYGRDPQAMELLAAAQNAMGGKRNLEAIHDWQRIDRVTWEINRQTTVETTTYAAPSGIRVESQGANSTVDFSNGAAGWTWSSSRPIRSPLPAATAAGMPLRSLPALLLSDDDPQRSITLAGPSLLLITDRQNERVYLKIDPSTHLPQAIAWMNVDGSELQETYSNWRQSAGVMWWSHMSRLRNRQEFLRADVTSLRVNQGWTPQRLAYLGP